MPYSFWTHYQSRNDLREYEDNALLLFALQLRFGIEDIATTAAEAITGGSDDKGADAIYIDTDTRTAVIVQGYIAENMTKREASSRKASLLSDSVSWLLGRNLNELPAALQPRAQSLRAAIEDDRIDTLELWYVHNLFGSQNVRRALETVESTANAVLRQTFPECSVKNIRALEVDCEKLDTWYRATTTPIIVDEEFTVPISGGYETRGKDWTAYVTSIPAHWLHSVYQQHKELLFSANVRGYLGSRRSDSNINNGIKKTVSSNPGDFWVFNNGITALVNNFEVSKDKSKIIFRGLSIVNGAQTTGAIGSLEDTPDDLVLVSARFITCSNADIIHDIVRYNNSQNRINPSDFRSTDQIQIRLRSEFENYPGGITYLGARRGGAEDSIRRPGRNSHIPSNTIAQALTAFHGKPILAYESRSDIWESDSNYAYVFNDKTNAAHMVFVYSLHKAVINEKGRLGDLHDPTNADKENLYFLRLTGSYYMLVAAVGHNIETIIDRKIPDRFRLRFKGDLDLNSAIDHWKPVIDSILPAHGSLKEILEKRLKGQEDAQNALRETSIYVQQARRLAPERFSEFVNYVTTVAT